MPGLEGMTLGVYQLKRLLGQGGMSEVYLAYDGLRERDVAIKVIGGNGADYLERFRREAEAIDKLQHEHILPAFDYDDQDPWHYLVMLYAPGETLRERLAGGALTVEDAGEMLEQIASALQHAHDHGILHRDIKPSNILLRDDHYAYLADFGLAKMLLDEREITKTGILMGTPEYMAPELSSGPATKSSDIYALGILLYQMVAGRVPFKGDTPFSTYWKHLHEQPLPPSQLNPTLPPILNDVILCALEKDPALRFQSVAQLADAYNQALERYREAQKADVSAYAVVTLNDEASLADMPCVETPVPLVADLRETSVAGEVVRIDGRQIRSPGQVQQRMMAERPSSKDKREKYAVEPVAPLPPLPLRVNYSLPDQLQTPVTPYPTSLQQRSAGRAAVRVRHAKRNAKIAASIIIFGLLILIVLPMAYITYIYETQHTSEEISQSMANLEQHQVTQIMPLAPDIVHGAPILLDSLVGNTDKRWAEDPTHCVFANGAYHVTSSDFVQSCPLRAPTIADGIVQVAVSLLSGNSAGMLLRVNGERFYDFEINNRGQFFFRRHDAGAAQSSYVMLINATSSHAIMPGTAENTLLIIAHRDDFMLYINGSFVGETHDSTYASGQVALTSSTQSPTTLCEGSFSDLEMYRLALTQ